MKIIKKIFIDDIISLSKNFFALVIAIGICFLPALYAWFNIYSNWDPYGSTGALKMAVYSEDKGYTTEDGEYQNQGDSIVENLHENKSVDWQFVDSADTAIDGVYSGKYYAAIVIDENFTYSLYNVFSEQASEPTLVFYQNQKKNPVATKISDTVVSTLQNNINEAFIEVVISEVFSGASNLYDDIQDEGGTEGIINNLKTLSEKLDMYEATINSVIANDKILVANLQDAESDTQYLQNQSVKSAGSVDSSNAKVADTQLTLQQYNQDVDKNLKKISESLDDISDTIEKAELAKTYNAMIDCLQAVGTDLANIKKNKAAIDAAIAAQQALPINGVSYDESLELNLASSETDAYMESLEQWISDTSVRYAQEGIKTTEEEILKTVKELSKKVKDLQNSFNTQLVPQTNEAIDQLEIVLNNTSDMLISMGNTFGSTTTMFVALEATLGSADVSLDKTNQALAYVNSRIKDAIESAEAVVGEEKMEVLVNTLSGDPELYGKFFSEPVQIETEAVYPVANYGSAVAPFYTTLAIWVGALILTAIIKVHPDKKKYPKAKNAELYFGRLILYWLLGQLQAIVIVVGDIALLGIQCVEPGWFMFAAAVTSFTFTTLIYSLVTTWGDAGKALAVVIVVLQIAGSSGTYPIELLPEFFRKVYIFFPFPYAINAMRECTCGMYENDYLIYLLELCIFVVVSFAIGLLLKIPFEEINHYMEERMEETEMM